MTWLSASSLVGEPVFISLLPKKEKFTPAIESTLLGEHLTQFPFPRSRDSTLPRGTQRKKRRPCGTSCWSRHYQRAGKVTSGDAYKRWDDGPDKAACSTSWSETLRTA